MFGLEADADACGGDGRMAGKIPGGHVSLYG
jgi:hypothetical protein